MLSISLTSHGINSNPIYMNRAIFDNGILYGSKNHLLILFLGEVYFILDLLYMRILLIFNIISLKEKGCAVKNKRWGEQ